MSGVTAMALTPTDQDVKYMSNGWTVFSALYELFGLSRPCCLSTSTDVPLKWAGADADYVPLASFAPATHLSVKRPAKPRP